MPTVTATAYPDRDYVLVESDWRDTPGTTHVRAFRVRADTGERTALYPYVAFNASGCMMLHCGQVLWWDTDPPLGVELTYEVEQCADRGLEFVHCSDTYNRAATVASWGTSTSGCLWSPNSAIYSTNGTNGIMAPAAVNVSYQQTVPGDLPHATVYGEVASGAVALTSAIQAGAMTRWTNSSNFMNFGVMFQPGGTVQGAIQTVVGAVFTNIATGTITGLTYGIGTRLNFKAVSSFTFHSLTIWPVGTVEPDPQLTVFDGTINVPGRTGLQTRLITGNTNVLPFNVTYDNFRSFDQNAADTFQVAVSAPVTLDAGRIWLKSPLQPCADVELITCGGAATYTCENPDVRQIVFSQMSEESFAANTVNLLPVNRRRPIPTYRIRRDIEATLTVVTRTFADRDALREANLPGYPLFFQAPPEYGIADRYMSIGTVTESRGLPDHRFQPRVVQLPHAIVDRPEGSADGVCGARVGDLCDIYSTWDAINAVGLTYLDILLGEAGLGAPGSTPVVDMETWQEVLDGYANWGAVNNGQDWEGVLES
jgi:hypothetical protein